MAKGDKNDFLIRLHALLPPSWFNDKSPMLEATLSACASSLSWCHALYRYTRQQTRISTATDGWLDISAYDFFGNSLNRPDGMADDHFRIRIKTNLLRERGTRQAVIDITEMLTGNKPIMFEPSRPADTGAYGGPAIGYGEAGGYGSRYLPYQAFVSVNRPRGQGIPWVAGYGTSTAGYSISSRAEYVSRQMITGCITDAQIYAAIAAVKPEGSLVWVRIH